MNKFNCVFNSNHKHLLLIILSCFVSFQRYLSAQPGSQKQGIIFPVSDDGEYKLKFTFLNQIWLRYTDANPGSTVYGDAVTDISDVGLRRTRFQLFGPLSDKVYVYFQFGQNNYSYLSKRFEGFFIHDATAEYRVNNALHLGAGLSGWSGMSRFASPSAGTIAGLDAPLYQQATNSVSDQFLRKLGIYAKGVLGKLDYRLALSKPSAIQNSNVQIAALSTFSEFNPKAPQLQKQAYLSVHLANAETFDTPYTVGTYLGEKTVFNIGGGIIHQSNAQWHLNQAGDTVFTDMLLLGLDVYYDAPLNAGKRNSLSVYSALNYYDFGPKYSRNVGVMNPSNGNSNLNILSGGGNAFPMISSGVTSYTQVAYATGYIKNSKSRLGIYTAAQISNTEKYNDLIWLAEGGLNWYISGTHHSKLTLAYQNRGVYEIENSNVEFAAIENGRKSMIVLQFQVMR